MISVEVAYAKPERQTLLTVSVLPNATVEDAIIASGILTQFSELQLDQLKVGVFSQRVELTTRLREGDRVEIYRPLLIDPKIARHQRVKRSL